MKNVNMLHSIKLNFTLHNTSMGQQEKTFALLETFVIFEYIFMTQYFFSP